MVHSELLTADEAAQRLRITRKTLLKWARQGKIERYKPSKKVVLFSGDAIDRVLQEQTDSVESPPKKKTANARSRKSVQGGDRPRSRKSWPDLRKEVTPCQ